MDKTILANYLKDQYKNYEIEISPFYYDDDNTIYICDKHGKLLITIWIQQTTILIAQSDQSFIEKNNYAIYHTPIYLQEPDSIQQMNKIIANILENNG